MADIETLAGMRVKGIYELREGKCPRCHVYFDDEEHNPNGDKRWCPKCKQYQLGKLKGRGKLI